MTDTRRDFLKSPRTWQIALAVYWLVIFVATHIPLHAPLMPPSSSDKLAHFSAYALLAILLATTWQLAAGHLTARHLVVAWLVIVIYGALDEWTQIPVGRDCDVRDWIADASGALVALVLFAWLRERVGRRKE